MADAASRYLTFDRDEWAELRAATPLTCARTTSKRCAASTSRIDLDEVAAVYLPLTRLLNLYVAATQNLHKVVGDVPRHATSPKVPYVIGVAGSVAVGKSTFARILQALLARWPDHPTGRPGHDRRLPPPEPGARRARHHEPQGLPRELRHPAADRVPARAEERCGDVTAPVYSHVVYDIVDGDEVDRRASPTS